MTDLNNKLNLNNVRGASYTPNFKSEEEVKTRQHVEPEAAEIKGDGTKAADSYGRALVKTAGKIENPEMIQCVKDSVDSFLKNPELAAAAVRSCDDSHELLMAQGAADAYEKACCGSCDAAYARMR